MRAVLAIGLCLCLGVIGCGRSGAVGGGAGEGDALPLPAPRDLDALEVPHVWHSWDVVIEDGTERHASVLDTGGNLVAALELYSSGANLSVQPGQPFDTWAAEHASDPASQDAGPVRYVAPDAYPYAGKNRTGRAGGEPAPAGALDLQLHPRDDDRLVVAAFVTPLPGRYVVTGFAAHRFLTGGDDSWVALYLGSTPGVLRSDILTPANDTVWVFHDGDVDLGTLPANERICFGLWRGGAGAFDDATEIAWTIVRTDP